MFNTCQDKLDPNYAKQVMYFLGGVSNEDKFDKGFFDKIVPWVIKNDLVLPFVSNLNNFPLSFINQSKLIEALYWREHKKVYHYLAALNHLEIFFQKIGVSFVPMKGLDFINRYYTDPFQRSFCDIDIVVQKKDITKVYKAMEDSEDFVICSTLKFSGRNQHFHVKMSLFNDLILEVHWQILLIQGYRSNFEENIRDGIINIVNGSFRFSNEMNMCLCTISFFSSISNPCRSLLDTYNIIKYSDVDWEKLERVSYILKVNKRLKEYLTLFHEIYPCSEIKNDFLNNSWVLSRVRIKYLKRICLVVHNISRIERFFFRFFMFEGYRDYFLWLTNKVIEKIKYFDLKFLFKPISLLHDFFWDIRLGINTSILPKSFRFDTNYLPTTYLKLLKLKNNLKMDENDVFIDLGCGSGRVVSFISKYFALKKIVGIDIQPEIIDIAKRNFTSIRLKHRLKTCRTEFFCGDILSFDLDQGTVYYIFSSKIIIQFLEKIKKSLENNPRKIKIILLGPGEILKKISWINFVAHPLGKETTILEN